MVETRNELNQIYIELCLIYKLEWILKWISNPKICSWKYISKQTQTPTDVSTVVLAQKTSLHLVYSSAHHVKAKLLILQKFSMKKLQTQSA